jgi:predicted TIM-barrel fold metal-dependent hydrolase
MSDNVIIVSLDGHAQLPNFLWEEYLPKQYHEHLPKLQKENEWFSGMMNHFNDMKLDAKNYDVFDLEHLLRNGGKKGLYDRDVRIEQMDRDGIASEWVIAGDNTFSGLFYQSSNQNWPQQLCQAGVKGYNRWLHDEFGKDQDRLHLIGLTGSAPWRTMDEMLAEVDWCKEHGFKSCSMPLFVTYPGQPPLFDRYWDPYWARLEEYGMPVWMHAGQGEGQGELGATMRRVSDAIEKQTGANFEEKVEAVAKEFLIGKVFSSVKPRRAMWQLMASGVFDRFPKLKLVLSEIYGDWMPPLLALLDAEFDKVRGEIPAKRKPSEYWATNGINGLSFIRRCEIALRHEIGVETLGFGRDYPHAEGTWPNTPVWIRDAFKGVPEQEMRDIMGLNAIRILGLDLEEQTALAARYGPSIDDILGEGPEVPASLIEHFNRRGHYSEPPEGESRYGEMKPMLEEDLWRLSAVPA